jgi:hypothetical protein
MTEVKEAKGGLSLLLSQKVCCACSLLPPASVLTNPAIVSQSNEEAHGIVSPRKHEQKPSAGPGPEPEDKEDAVVMGLDIPFTCKVYFGTYKPAPLPTASAATPAPAPAAATTTQASDAKSAPAPSASTPAPAAAPASTPSKQPKHDRLAIEPGMIVVHITEDARTEKLLALAIQASSNKLIEMMGRTGVVG